MRDVCSQRLHGAVPQGKNVQVDTFHSEENISNEVCLNKEYF